jgi:DNA-binding NarL/FixJ family response regulator
LLGVNGWEVVEEIRHQKLPTRILIFTSYEFDSVVRVAMAAGCDGVLSKSKASAELLLAVRDISQGRKFMPIAAGA